MIAMPAAMAPAGPCSSVRWPFTRSVPLSGWCTPARIFTTVDLPAPFSPTSACASPARSSIDPSITARTAPNDLLTRSSERTTGPSGSAEAGESGLGASGESGAAEAAWVSGAPAAGAGRESGTAAAGESGRSRGRGARGGLAVVRAGGAASVLFPRTHGLHLLIEGRSDRACCSRCCCRVVPAAGWCLLPGGACCRVVPAAGWCLLPGACACLPGGACCRVVPCRPVVPPRVVPAARPCVRRMMERFKLP